MTLKKFKDYYGLPAAVVVTAGIVVWLLSSAFVTRREYERDTDRIERKLDCALWNLPTDCRSTMSPRMP